MCVNIMQRYHNNCNYLLSKGKKGWNMFHIRGVLDNYVLEKLSRPIPEYPVCVRCKDLLSKGLRHVPMM